MQHSLTPISFILSFISHVSYSPTLPQSSPTLPQLSPTFGPATSRSPNASPIITFKLPPSSSLLMESNLSAFHHKKIDGVLDDFILCNVEGDNYKSGSYSDDDKNNNQNMCLTTSPSEILESDFKTNFNTEMCLPEGFYPMPQKKSEK
jgi:hypothetical protein